MPREWTSPLRQLYLYLERDDKQFELFRDIDKLAPALTVPLEKTITLTSKRLAELVGAETGRTYIFDGSKFLLAPDGSSSHHSPVPEDLTPEDLGWDPNEQGQWRQKIIRKNDFTIPLARFFPASEVIGSLPLFLSEAECFGVILFDSHEAPEKNLLLNDKEIQELVDDVGQQISNAIRLRIHAQRTQLQSSLTMSFFRKALDPIECFDELARQVDEFLPNIGPLKIEPAPEVQILLYEPSENSLRIVGSTGSEIRGTRVSVNNSFCGKLINNPKLSHRVDDPHNDPSYKDYLGLEKGKEMRHELAVTIEWNRRIIGVLNLESEIPNAFSKRHIQAMVDLCNPEGNPSIAPMVYALKESIFMAYAQQMSMVSALDKHLDQVGHILRHGITTPKSTVNTNLIILEEGLAKDSSDLVENARLTRRAFAKLVDFIDAYSEDIGGFSKFTGRSIKDIVTRAIKITLNEIKDKNIDIIFNPKEDLVVYCSLLLTEHIYDLINNAVISIGERLLINPNVPGKIEITAELEPEPHDRQEKVLNRRCRVTILDNGMGVRPEVLAMIGRPEFSTRREKGGSGFGVFGAKSYIEALHGKWLDPESLEGVFFKVRFLLDIYNPAIHGSGSGI